jgi:methylthioribose-1-phosphate isomerase
MKAVEWIGDKLRILDQNKLPHAIVYLELNNYREVAESIKDMTVRGAPAIGVAAAYGIALGAYNLKADNSTDFIARLKEIISRVAATRPTARNLFMAMERMETVMSSATDVPRLKEVLVSEAKKIHREEIEATEKISSLGAELIKDGDTVLTHCNAGPIATAGYGTALGVIMEAHRQGNKISVLVTETRPLCQGARLTALELKEAGIPFKLITDSMAGHFLSRGKANLVITGADRIAKNGDTANKIGTYTLAVLAKENNVPFYVAAPTSTIDASIETGADIPIEERSPNEVTNLYGKRIAPEGVEALNPAFDVTPRKYITAIITERGIMSGLNIRR